MLSISNMKMLTILLGAFIFYFIIFDFIQSKRIEILIEIVIHSAFSVSILILILKFLLYFKIFRIMRNNDRD